MDDEELILLFNPFVNKSRKIKVKLENQFSEFSKLIIKKIPKEYTKIFVNQMKIQLVSPKKEFYSISEMIDYLHSSIKKNSVVVNKEIRQKFPEIEEEIFKLKQEFPLIDQPYICNEKKPKLKKSKADNSRSAQLALNEAPVEALNEGNDLGTQHIRQVNYHEDIEYNFEENDIQSAEMNEKLLFIALFRRLKTQDFITFLKLFGLYTYSVISYVGTVLFPLIIRVHSSC